MALKKGGAMIITIAFITFFLDFMNLAILTPVLPYLVTELNSTSMEQGILYSAYSVTQLISGLLMGFGSDRYGRKPFLLLSLFGSCFGSLMQGWSKTMWWLIVWRSFTGLFAGSLILVQAVIADVVPTEERNTYLSRLDGVGSAAFIIGPAIGGILCQVNNHLPLFVAGGVSGLALVFALFFLKESSPEILAKRAAKAKGESTSESTDAAKASEVTVETKEETPKEQAKEEEKEKPKVHLTLTMVLCFIFEFCIRWDINIFNSRYGIYLQERFNTPSKSFSALLVAGSVWNLFEQLVLYPFIVSKLGVPIPWISFIGMLINAAGLVLMTAKTQVVSMGAAFLFWIGYCFGSPSSASILSTTSRPEVQGQVLAYNNAAYQTALIISPLVAGAIYTVNREWVFYSSAILVVCGGLTMAYMCTWKNVKEIGKKVTVEEEPKKEIEMKEEPKKEEVKKEEAKVEIEMKVEEAKAEEPKKEEAKVEIEMKEEPKKEAEVKEEPKVEVAVEAH